MKSQQMRFRSLPFSIRGAILKGGSRKQDSAKSKGGLVCDLA
jgi:hypothetical protein